MPQLIIRLIYHQLHTRNAHSAQSANTNLTHTSSGAACSGRRCKRARCNLAALARRPAEAPDAESFWPATQPDPLVAIKEACAHLLPLTPARATPWRSLAVLGCVASSAAASCESWRVSRAVAARRRRHRVAGRRAGPPAVLLALGLGTLQHSGSPAAHGLRAGARLLC